MTPIRESYDVIKGYIDSSNRAKHIEVMRLLVEGFCLLYESDAWIAYYKPRLHLALENKIIELQRVGMGKMMGL